MPTSDSVDPASLAAQSKVDQLLRYVNEQIELLAFEDPSTELLDQMIQSLVDPRRSVRISLVETLGQIGEPAIPLLLEALRQHPEPMVRRACCNALMNMGDETVVSGLVNALLHDQDISVKSAAAGALAKVGAPAFEAIRGVLASSSASESCKGHAAWALASMSNEISDRLQTCLQDPSATVRIAIVGAIAQLAQRQMAGQVAEQVAGQMVGQVEPDPLTPAQRNQEQSTPPTEPTMSSQPATAIESNMPGLLIQALEDASADVRIEAIAHLARLSYQPAYQPLVDCLQQSDWEVRKAAVLALGKLGNAAAVDVISPLQQDAEPAVQRVATLVLTQLTAS